MVRKTLFETIEIGVKAITVEERDGAHLWTRQFQVGIPQGAGWEGQWMENH